MIDRIERVSLVDMAYNRIKQSLLKEEIKEGQLIPSENQFCKMLNVSRVVVREALQRLRSERFIVTYQGKGSFMANPENFSTPKPVFENFDYSAFCEIMQFRSAIEYSAISLAVEHASDQELQKLSSLVYEMHIYRDDEEKFNQSDFDFHNEILKCSHNNIFVRASKAVEQEIKFCLKSMNKVLGSRDWAITLHQQIADKMIARDAKGAIDLLKNNGEYNIARMKELFAE